MKHCLKMRKSSQKQALDVDSPKVANALLISAWFSVLWPLAYLLFWDPSSITQSVLLQSLLQRVCSQGTFIHPSRFITLTCHYRIVLFQVFGPIERAKYYAIWTLTEVRSQLWIPFLFWRSFIQGASILTGLGFNGFSSSGKPLWDGAANVKVLEIEFPPNFKLLLDSWNMKTNIWLRECVYKRVTPKGKKPGFSSSMITFLTSAFWVHRFYFLSLIISDACS